jgi:lysophospholipase L1-like esterase
MKHFFKNSICLALLITWLAPSLYAQETPKWENEMEAFREADRVQPPARRAILFTGSSSIRLWKDLKKYFPTHDIINRGFGGSHLEDVIALADQLILLYQPRQVVIYAGDNDIASGKTADEIAADFQLLFRKIRSYLPSTHIVFISIKPSPARVKYLEETIKANQQVKKFIKGERNAAYADVFSLMLDKAGKPQPELFLADSLHMNDRGYEIWAGVLKRYLAK